MTDWSELALCHAADLGWQVDRTITPDSVFAEYFHEGDIDEDLLAEWMREAREDVNEMYDVLVSVVVSPSKRGWMLLLLVRSQLH